MSLIRDWAFRLVAVVLIHAKLVLVVRAVEAHFDLLRIRGVGMRVIHWTIAGGLVVDTFGFVLGEGNLLFLGFRLRFGAEGGVKLGLVDVIEVGGVAVGDGDVIVEAGASKDEFLLPGRCSAEESFGVVGKDAHDEFVEFFRGGRGLV